MTVQATGRAPDQEPGLAGLGGQEVLVVTDGHRRGHDLLGLPFREATVLELTGDEPSPAGSGRRYSAVLVDRTSFDLRWLAEAVRGLLPLLQPGGQVVIAFDPDGGPVPPAPAEPVSFAGLEWGGLVAAGGRTCAVLRQRAGAAPGPIAEHLATAAAAVRLAAAGERQQRVALAVARQACATLAEDQYRSERALLAHLERLAEERDRLRSRTLRARLRRSRLARPARSVRRRLRRIVRRWRGVVGRRLRSGPPAHLAG